MLRVGPYCGGVTVGRRTRKAYFSIPIEDALIHMRGRLAGSRLGSYGKEVMSESARDGMETETQEQPSTTKFHADNLHF